MRVVEVYVNGEKVCAAGLPSPGHVGTSVTWSARDRGRSGLMSVSGEDGSDVVFWLTKPLGVGDDVTIRLCESDHADPPTLRQPIEYLADPPPG